MKFKTALGIIVMVMSVLAQGGRTLNWPNDTEKIYRIRVNNLTPYKIVAVGTNRDLKDTSVTRVDSCNISDSTKKIPVHGLSSTTYHSTSGITQNYVMKSDANGLPEQSSIYNSGNRTGLGTNNPICTLDVRGVVAFGSYSPGQIYFSNDLTYPSINFNHSINGSAEGYVNYGGYNNGTTQFRIFNVGDGKNSVITRFDGSSKTQSNYGAFVSNELGGDYDFRVESDNNTHLIFGDASTNRVGILKSNPGYAFHVGGSIGTDSTLSLRKISPVGGDSVVLYHNPVSNYCLKFKDSASHLYIKDTTYYDGYYIKIGPGSLFANSLSGSNLSISQWAEFNTSLSNSQFLIHGDNVDTLLSANNGGNDKIGVRTSSPTTTVDINGSIAIGKIRTLSSTSIFSVYDSNYVIRMDIKTAGANHIDLNLPLAASYPRRIIVVTVIGDGFHNGRIYGSSVNDSISWDINYNPLSVSGEMGLYESFTFQSDGVNTWYVIQYGFKNGG